MKPLGTNRRRDLPGCYSEFRTIDRYIDHKLGATAKILPGEYYVTESEEWITTVLGSCISACIRDPRAGIGGMNHFMLPLDKTAPAADPSTPLSRRTPTDLLSGANRYGNFAMENLINTILKHGGRRHALEVKIVGGGNVLDYMNDIGSNNIVFVRNYLETEGFEIVGQDVGGSSPRRVLYHPITGVVRVRKPRETQRDTAAREQQMIQSFEQKPVEAGEVELF